MKRVIILGLFLFSFQLLFGQNYIANLDHFNVENGLSHNQINWIHKDQKGMLWIGTFNGINRYDGQEFKYVQEVDFSFAGNSNMFEDETGDLWLQKSINDTKDELFFFNTVTEHVKSFEEKFGSNPPFQKSDFKERKKLEDNSIQIQLKSGKKITLPHLKAAVSLNQEQGKEISFNIETGKVEIFHSDQPEVPIITTEEKELIIYSPSVSLKDGYFYWTGSVNGIYKLQLKINPFNKAAQLAPHQLYSCREITEDKDGNVYVSRHGPIINIKTGLSIGNRKYAKAYHGLFYDKNDRLWFEGKDELYRVNLETGDHQTFDFEDGVPPGTLWTFYQDKNDRIWGGMGNGLTYYESDFSTFKYFKKLNGFKDVFNASVYHFFEESDGSILLSTANGLYRLDLEKGITDRFWKGGEGVNYLPSNDIRHIHKDKDSIYWIASKDGLIRWDRKNASSKLFTTSNGFSNNVLHSVYEDDFGFLWLSSENGIIQFEKNSFRVKNYLSGDGITHSEFNRVSHYQDKAGNIYFGSMNGVTYFHPKDFVDIFNQSIDVPIILTECSIFSEETKTQENRKEDFYKNKKITIAPSDRFLTLQFALLDYSNSLSLGLQYVYEIDGERWKTSNDNSISISSLPYGNHTLTVKGRTSSGLFSKQTLSIPIVVLKPFYLQWWFLGLCIAALAFAIFIYQKRKTQQLVEQKVVLEKTVQERTKTVIAQSETLKTQAEKLQQLNKAKSKFMANISHEFRTPLTLILNTLNFETKKEKLNGSNEGRTFTYSEKEAEIMNRNTHNLQRLIEQMLDLAKSEAEKLSLRASQNNFQLYLRDLVLSFQPIAKNKNISLSFSSELEDCQLYFDREKMDKIIYNLMGNALKFTPENKNVKVLLEKTNTEVVFKVFDNGIGIPKEELPYIFDRFYRGDLKDEFAYEGTGLGLALVKEFVELHHGKIEVESEIGKGTSFTIHLPIGDVHLLPEEIMMPSVAENKLSKQIKIGNSILEESPKPTSDEEKPILLIIEDNQDLLYHHQQNFQNTYQLILAKNGEEGIEMAIEHLPDVIVCDVMMPKKNGYEVCQQLKLDEKTNHIPIILLTAKADFSEKMEGLMVGADHYLTKPYQQKELEIRIKNSLTLQQHLQEKFKIKITEPIPASTVKTPQERFLEKCKSIVEQHYTNPDFSIEDWGNELYMSRPQFFRKVKAVLGTTPRQFIRTYRLEKAKELLSQNAGNGSEIAYMVGFKNPNYFFKCFKDEYGITVGDFVKS